MAKERQVSVPRRIGTCAFSVQTERSLHYHVSARNEAEASAASPFSEDKEANPSRKIYISNSLQK